MNTSEEWTIKDVRSFFRSLKSTINLVEENPKLFKSSAEKIRTVLTIIIRRFLDGLITLEQAREKTMSLMISIPNTVIAKGNADINECIRELRLVDLEIELINRFLKAANAPNN